VSAQVESQVAAGGFRDKDLATMLAGGNVLLPAVPAASISGEDLPAAKLSEVMQSVIAATAETANAQRVECNIFVLIL